MNSYDLADELDNILKAIGLEDNRVPTVLRQQADRIVELEKEVKELTFKQESLCKIIRMRLNDVPRSQHPSS